MSALSITFFMASALAIFLGNLIYFRDPKKSLNRIFFVLCLLAACLTLAAALVQIAEISEAAHFLTRVNALWPFVVSLSIHFVLVFTENWRLLKARVAYFLIYGPAAIFSFLGLTTDLMAQRLEYTHWSWIESAVKYSQLNTLALIWSISILLLSIYLWLRYYPKAVGQKSKQINYVLAGIILPGIFSVVARFLHLAFGEKVPELFLIGFLAGAVFFGYAIWRHDLFALTPEAAAENILSMIADALILADSEGKILRINEAAVELLGYKENELNGQSINAIFALNGKSKSGELSLKQLLSADSVNNIEITVKAKDTRKIPASLSRSIVLGRDGVCKGLVFTARDLTQQKQTERELQELLKEQKESAKEWQQTFDAATDIIALISPDYRILKVNRAGSMALGKKPEELIGKKCYEIVHGLKAPITGCPCMETIATKKPGSGEITDHGRVYIATADPVLDENNELIAFTHTIKDITERKKAEEAVQASEERLRSLAGNIPAIVYRGNPDWSMEIVSNSEISSGYKIKEFDTQKVNWIDIIHPDDKKTVLEESSKLSEKQTSIVQEYRILAKGGLIRWIEDRKTSRFTKEGVFQGVDGVVFDITERKKAEKALRRSEERFQHVAENAQEWIWEVDANGLYTYASPIVEKMLGCKQSEVVGKKHYYDFFHPEEKERLMKAAQGVFDKKESFHGFLNRNVHKNGKIVWLSTSGAPIIDDKGNLIGYRGADQDVTERLEMEQQLQESEKKFKSISRSAMDGIIMLDNEGNVTFWNEAAERIFGYAIDEVLGKELHMFIAPQRYRQAYAEGFKTFKTTGEGQIVGKRLELEGQRKDGTIFPFELSVSSVKLGGKWHAVGIARDITDRKKVEAEILINYENQTAISKLLRISLMHGSLEEQLSVFLEQVALIPWLGLKTKGAILLIEDDPNVLKLKAQLGLDEPLLNSCAQVPLGRWLCGRAALSRKTEFADGIDERHETSHEGIKPHGHYCVPILSGEKLLGVMNLYIDEAHQYNEKEISFLQTIADILAGIIERKVAEETVIESRDFYLKLFNRFPALIWRTGLDGKCDYVNRTWLGFTGKKIKEEVGEGWFQEIHPEDLERYKKTYIQSFNNRKPFRIEYRLCNSERQYRWMNNQGEPFHDLDGKFAGFIGSCYDISETKEQEQKLAFLAMHDPLTELPNRRALEDVLRRAVARARRGTMSALLFLDMDKFKQVNDTLGHGPGDQTLIDFVKVIQKGLRTEDFLVRIGGDEFAMLLEQTEIQEAQRIAERVRCSIEEHKFIIKKNRFQLSVSIGIALIDGKQDAWMVMARADRAMYSAKAKGRNKVVVS